MRTTALAVALAAALVASARPAAAQDTIRLNTLDASFSDGAGEGGFDEGDVSTAHVNDAAAVDSRVIPSGYYRLAGEPDWSASPDVGTAYLGDTWGNAVCAVPYTYFQANVLWLKIGGNNDRVLVVNDVAATNAITTNNIDFSRSQPGVEFVIGRQFDDVSALELSYFGAQNWTESSTVAAPGALSLPGLIALGTVDYLLADQATVAYEAEVHNVELNYKQSICGLNMLYGVRYLNENEQLYFSFTRGANTSTWENKVNNNFVGPQWGTGWHWQWGGLSTDIIGKAGVFANIAAYENTLSDAGGSVQLRNTKDNTATAAFIGEIGANASYQIFQWLSVRGGYRVIWIEGLVRAPQQLDFTQAAGAPGRISDHTGTYLHGAHVGLEARW